jgi:dienelactone hydrolase
MALLAGLAGEPSRGEPQESPYRVVRPEGNGPHPAILFVSGCSGFTPHVRPNDVAGDILAAAAYARARPFIRASEISVIGYGIDTPWKTSVPLLMLLGGLDDVSPARACQELVTRLSGDLPIEVRLYPAARHAFDVPELPPLLRRERGGTLGHDPQAAAAAREEVKRFLAR